MAAVFLFTHDEPDVEAKHLINPNGRHDVNATDQFENLLADTFADGNTIEDTGTRIRSKTPRSSSASLPNRHDGPRRIRGKYSLPSPKWNSLTT
jgi:hypothetical protein